MMIFFIGEISSLKIGFIEILSIILHVEELFIVNIEISLLRHCIIGRNCPGGKFI